MQTSSSGWTASMWKACLSKGLLASSGQRSRMRSELVRVTRPGAVANS